MSLSLKELVVCVLVVNSVVGAPISCSYYTTNGEGELAIDEGVKVVAPSGADKIVVRSSQECVAACEVQMSNCTANCCDGISYNPQKQECYLKQGGSRFESSENTAGWQSFWRVGSGVFNGDSASELVSEAGGAAACKDDLQISGYGNAYVSMGPGQLAVNEGESIKTKTGKSMVRVETIDKCALECEAVAVCNAFSMNLDTGVCYLKKGGKQFDTTTSQNGWTTYWKLPETDAKNRCKEQGYFCLYCGGNLNNSCRNY